MNIDKQLLDDLTAQAKASPRLSGEFGFEEFGWGFVAADA